MPASSGSNFVKKALANMDIGRLSTMSAPAMEYLVKRSVLQHTFSSTNEVSTYADLSMDGE